VCNPLCPRRAAAGMAIIPLVNRRLRRGKPSHPHFRKPSARHRVEDMPVTGLVQVLPAFRKPTARMGFQETALGVRAYRQELIASNIANADTPGYKAVDIDFQEALRVARSIANTPRFSLATTVSGHIQGVVQSSLTPYPLKYHLPMQPSVDGNTVDMDVERAKFAENAVMWEFSRDRVSGHFKHMMEMLQNLKD